MELSAWQRRAIHKFERVNNFHLPEGTQDDFTLGDGLTNLNVIH